MNEKEYKKSLRQFHKHSDRHILVVETDMSFSDIQKVVALSDKIRKAGERITTSLSVRKGIGKYGNFMVLQKRKRNEKYLPVS